MYAKNQIHYEELSHAEPGLLLLISKQFVILSLGLTARRVGLHGGLRPFLIMWCL